MEIVDGGQIILPYLGVGIKICGIPEVDGGDQNFDHCPLSETIS